MTSPISKKNNGFTLLEVTVSIALFIVVITMTANIFSLSNRSYAAGAQEQELWQNARTILDRLTRELRQAQAMVTDIPATPDDELNPPPSTLEFQDGHTPDTLTYIRYFLAGDEIKRQHLAYYFASQPDTYVTYNSRDEFNNLPQELILDEHTVGQFFSDIDFWGDGKLINIKINLSKQNKNIKLQTAVSGRNL